MDRRNSKPDCHRFGRSKSAATTVSDVSNGVRAMSFAMSVAAR